MRRSTIALALQLPVVALAILGGWGAVRYYFHLHPTTPASRPAPYVGPPSPSEPSTGTGALFLDDVLSTYGKPDVLDDTYRDTPRPPVVTVWAIYRRAGVRFDFRPERLGTDPARGTGWVCWQITDEATHRRLTRQARRPRRHVPRKAVQDLYMALGYAGPAHGVGRGEPPTAP